MTSEGGLICLLQQSGINQLMQIVSEAIFERLKQSPLLYTATHNRLAYVTSSDLTVREIAIESICSNLKIRGRQVIGLSLENPHYIVILYAQGVLQVRRIESLSHLVLTATNIRIQENKFKIRVSLDTVYILCGNFVEKIHLTHDNQREQIYLSQKQTDYAEDMLISSILQEEKILILQFPSAVSLEIQGIPIARLEFERISEIKLLRDPLLAGDINTKQYLLVVEMNKWLKIYDVVTLQQILQMELFLQKFEAVQIKIDPLHEYLMLRVFHKNTKVTIRNSLLKVNKQYYHRQSKDPFFLFDIQLGLKQDLILFPTHLELINNTQFHSIDMCFFTAEHIKIATLVVDINHRTRLYHTNHFDPNWTPIEHWNQIINNMKSQQPKGKSKRQRKLPQLQHKNQSDYQWNKFIRQFWQQNMQKFQSEGIVFNFDKQQDQIHKYIEYPTSKHTIKDNQMQDALNTLSGSSSFRSTGENIYNEETLLRMIEGVDLSIELSKKEKLSDLSANPPQQQCSDSDISQTNEYFCDVQDRFLELVKPIDEKMDVLENKIGRISDIHVHKLKKIQRNIRRHAKQVNKLQQSIPKWCEEQMSLFSSQLKESLNTFNATVTRLQIMGTRRLKKMKKGYRDFLDEQVESRQEKAEQNEQAYTRKLQSLMKELELK